jgi:hypothetical protein
MIASNMTPNVDPVKRATVHLGDKDYPLKFRLSDLTKLSTDHGIDLFVPVESRGIEAIMRMAKIIQAGIAHTGAQLSLDDIAESIELPEIPVYALAITEATKKASPESVRASKALADMAPKKPAEKPDPSIQ